MAPVDDVLDRLERCFYDPRHKEDVATVRQELQRLREDVRAERDEANERVRRLREGLREIDKLDGRYHDLNTARWMARKTLDAASPDGANTEGGEA